MLEARVRTRHRVVAPARVAHGRVANGHVAHGVEASGGHDRNAWWHLLLEHSRSALRLSYSGIGDVDQEVVLVAAHDGAEEVSSLERVPEGDVGELS